MRWYLLCFIMIISSSFVFAISPSSYSNDTLLINPTFAFDSDDLSYANLSGQGFATYYDFLVTNNNSEIKAINLSITYQANITGNYSFSWTLNDTWHLLYNSSINVSKTSKNFSLPIFSWDEIKNNLSINISVEGTILLYELLLYVTYDDQGPNIILLDPVDNHIQNFSNINFSFTANDQLSGLENCSLYLNNQLNKTNTSMIESVTTNFSLSLQNGLYDWFIKCYDNSTGNYFNNSEIRRFGIDLLPPNITLILPANESTYSSGEPVKLEFNFSDVSENATCDLLINDSINQTSVNWPNLNQYFLIYLANGGYSWQINCTDVYNRSALSEKRFFTLDNNEAPYFTNNVLTQNISLGLGLNTHVWCNATVNDASSAQIIDAKAKFIYGTYEGSDDEAFQYSNSSCLLLPNNATSRLVVCSFDLSSKARAGSWYCYLNSTDSGGLTGFYKNISQVEPFYAINLTPDFISYGSWKVGEITDDVAISIDNLGNSPIDITLEGYAVSPYDGLAMACGVGNISISDHKYSLTNGELFANMISLTSNPALVDINLAAPTQYVSSKKDLFWKTKLPSPLNGSCDGNVVITVVPN